MTTDGEIVQVIRSILSSGEAPVVRFDVGYYDRKDLLDMLNVLEQRIKDQELGKLLGDSRLNMNALERFACTAMINTFYKPYAKD